MKKQKEKPQIYGDTELFMVDFIFLNMNISICFKKFRFSFTKQNKSKRLRGLG